MTRQTNAAQIAADAIRDRRAAERKMFDRALSMLPEPAPPTAASYEADGYDAQDDAAMVSDAEATHLERVLGIAS